MKKPNQIKRVSFPSSAHTNELKIEYLLTEAQKRNRQVLGTINNIDINVWPNDNLPEIIDWFNKYTEHSKLEELLPNNAKS